MKVCGGLVFYLMAFLGSVSFNIIEAAPVTVYRMDISPETQYKVKVIQDDYMQKRQEILLVEQHERVGGEIVLSEAEKRVDSMILKAKQAEVDNSLIGGQPFAPALNFLQSKPMIERSDVYKIIQRMPKGGALHVHDVSITNINWLVQNVTYRDNCYMCYDVNKSISFKFFLAPPSNPGCPWRLVSDYRKESGNATQFDEMLYESMVLTEKTLHQGINPVWKRFEEILGRAEALINHRPVFGDYYYEALKEFYDDNIQYIEIRALLSPVYELDGSEHDSAYVMEIYKNTTELFKANYPDFTGAKIIKTNLRFLPANDILADVKNSVQLMQQFPNYFAGYDLVGQEDPGEPLLYYLNALRYPSQQTPPVNLPYFFHAGETDWEGTKVDDNLIDAVLLNTTRIGHAYAITKHPEVMRLVKARGIAIEINPISNQVLKLVDDLRNHPGSVLISEGFPVTISSDDPSVWGAKGLSHDFYATFMALCGETDGLQVLKQLAMNSLIYSAMRDDEKVAALKAWEKKWASFIQNMTLWKYMIQGL